MSSSPSPTAVGVHAVATYAPTARLSAKELRRNAAGSAPAGVRNVAVADVDEDIVTMSAEVIHALALLTSAELDDIDGLIVCTSSSPYAEHSAAAEVARALSLRRDAWTVDLAGSARGTIAAVRMAADAVAAGRGARVVVVAADRRRGRTGASSEVLGAGAAAVLVGANASAELGRSAARRHGVPTRWRPDGSPALHTYDDPRYERDEIVLPAIRAVLPREPEAFLALGLADARTGPAVVRAIGWPSADLGDDEVTELGDLGSASPFFSLGHILQRHASGCGWLAAFEAGSGADAIALTITGEVPVVHVRPPTRDIDYVDYLRSFGMLAAPAPPEPIVPWAATPGASRDDSAGSLSAARCDACGSLNVPARKRCIDCNSADLATVRPPRNGRLITYNVQHVVAVFPEAAPVSVGVARVDGAEGTRGGQVSAMFCDTAPDLLRVGAPVELVYRRAGIDDGLVKYGWKLRVLAQNGVDDVG